MQQYEIIREKDVRCMEFYLNLRGWVHIEHVHLHMYWTQPESLVCNDICTLSQNISSTYTHQIATVRKATQYCKQLWTCFVTCSSVREDGIAGYRVYRFIMSQECRPVHLNSRMDATVTIILCLHFLHYSSAVQGKQQANDIPSFGISEPDQKLGSWISRCVATWVLMIVPS